MALSATKAAGSLDWYFITDDDDLTLRITNGLCIGEDANGELALNDGRTACRWLAFTIKDNNELWAATQGDAWYIEVGDLVVREFRLDSGTAMQLPHATLHISNGFQRPTDREMQVFVHPIKPLPIPTKRSNSTLEVIESKNFKPSATGSRKHPTAAGEQESHAARAGESIARDRRERSQEPSRTEQRLPPTLLQEEPANIPLLIESLTLSDTPKASFSDAQRDVPPEGSDDAGVLTPVFTPIPTPILVQEPRGYIPSEPSANDRLADTAVNEPVLTPSLAADRVIMEKGPILDRLVWALPVTALVLFLAFISTLDFDRDVIGSGSTAAIPFSEPGDPDILMTSVDDMLSHRAADPTVLAFARNAYESVLLQDPANARALSGLERITELDRTGAPAGNSPDKPAAGTTPTQDPSEAASHGTATNETTPYEAHGTPTPDTPTPDALQQTLASAQALADDGFLTHPQGQSAVSLAQDVLARDADNPAARDLLSTAADRLAVAAQDAIDVGMYQEASVLAQDVLAFYPNHARALSIAATTAEVLDAP